MVILICVAYCVHIFGSCESYSHRKADKQHDWFIFLSNESSHAFVSIGFLSKAHSFFVRLKKLNSFGFSGNLSDSLRLSVIP